MSLQQESNPGPEVKDACSDNLIFFKRDCVVTTTVQINSNLGNEPACSKASMNTVHDQTAEWGNFRRGLGYARQNFTMQQVLPFRKRKKSIFWQIIQSNSAIFPIINKVNNRQKFLAYVSAD